MIPTPHIGAEKKEDFAKTVLMPGDPLRAKFIADTFLTNVVQVNNIRGMLGFTGEYNGKKVSVMGSGMGMASMGIYSYELFKFYDVENIIRIGSAGAYTKDLNLYDVVLVDDAWSESTFASVQDSDNTYGSIIESSGLLNKKLEDSAKKLDISITHIRTHSSDIFYHESNKYFEMVRDKHGVSAVEMESVALFHNANITNKNAACLLTISDNLVTHEATSSEERQTAFTKMMEIALDTAVK